MSRSLLAVLVSFAAFLLFGLIARPLLPIDETRYLAVAWEMHLSGDPFHLTRNFESYSHKPPLLFWLINLVWLVTGVSELAGRMVGPAFALLAVAGTGLLARRLWPDEPALEVHAPIILIGFTLFAVYSGTTMFDAILTVATLAGIAVIWRIGSGEAGRGVWLALGFALALGAFAKGPVILIHLLPPLLLVKLWAPKPPRMGQVARGLGLSIGLALGLMALWLVPTLLTGDAAFREELLWTQSAGRVSGSMGHGRPVWFLLALLPVILFPWAWSWRVWRVMGMAAPASAAGRLCLIWAASGLVLFSLIGGKQVHYLLPELPAVALLMARGLGFVRPDTRGGSLAALVPLALGALALAAGAGFIPLKGDLATLSPAWALFLFGAVCIGLAAATIRLPLVRGHLVLGLGLAAALHLLAMTTLLTPTFDAGPIAQRLARAEAAGIAFTGAGYHAEFNFKARLANPVATPTNADELAKWAVLHPGGVIIGPVGRAKIATPPTETWWFRHILYGLWPAEAGLISPG